MACSVSWLCSPPGRSVPSRSFDEAAASARRGLQCELVMFAPGAKRTLTIL